MTAAILLGAGVGLGLLMIVVWAFPARPTLAQAFAALHPPAVARAAVAPIVAPAGSPGHLASLGVPLAPLLQRLGLPRKKIRLDLAICGREPAQHLAEQASTALLGFLVPPALAAMLTLGGIAISWHFPLWASLVCAGLGMFLPDLALASEATKRRIQLRNAVSGMLDIVVISLASGSGIEQALRDGTDDPDGWADQALRHAVEAAHLRRRPPWQTLGELGETLGMTALSELAAALSMAGSEGARIKATLSARSAALQAHQLAEAEAAAASATERMVLPVVAQLGGFMIFIIFPAFATVLGAF